ncbi:MAG: hypothetical protein FD149_2183 [Rhodospirillaceae bacterium]|nr:MAG: hypothetical protein FD149_2183 [Rhodospirillaceae bacterium]
MDPSPPEHNGGTPVTLPPSLTIATAAEVRSLLLAADKNQTVETATVTGIDAAGLQLLFAASRRTPPPRLSVPPESVVARAAAAAGLDTPWDDSTQGSHKEYPHA